MKIANVNAGNRKLDWTSLCNWLKGQRQRPDTCPASETPCFRCDGSLQSLLQAIVLFTKNSISQRPSPQETRAPCPRCSQTPIADSTCQTPDVGSPSLRNEMETVFDHHVFRIEMENGSPRTPRPSKGPSVNASLCRRLNRNVQLHEWPAGLALESKTTGANSRRSVEDTFRPLNRS